MVLGSIRPQTEVTGKSAGGDEGGRCLRLINSPLSCADCLEIRVPQLPGNVMACTAL